MLLFYIRHGDPIYSPDSLTPLGERQAEAVAKRLAVYGLDKIFASSSNRAQLTAKPTAELLKKEVQVLDFCHEGNAWERFTVRDSDGRQKWIYQSPEACELLLSASVQKLGAHWYEHEALSSYRFADSVKWIDEETDSFMLSLGFKHDRERGVYEIVQKNSERIALFAHEGLGKAFLSSLLDVPYPLFCTHFELNHSGISVIRFDESRETTIPKLLMLSNDSHLYKDGLPTKYNNSIYL